MCPGNDSAGIFSLQFIKSDINACALKILAHFMIPVDAGIHEGIESVLKGRGVIGDIEPYDMHILLFVLGRKFYSRNDLSTGSTLLSQRGGVRQGLIQPICGIVVCDRYGSKAFLHSIVH